MNTADLVEFFQTRRAVPFPVAERLADSVVIRRKLDVDTDLFGNATASRPAATQPHSRKQRAVVEYLRINGTITLAQAVELVGADIYTNEAKHVGALLSNMVRQGMIKRVKPGLFAKGTP